MPIYITLFLREQVAGVAESDMNDKLLLLKRKQTVKLLTWHGMAWQETHNCTHLVLITKQHAEKFQKSFDLHNDLQIYPASVLDWGLS